MDRAKDSDLAHFLGDWNQSEKHSEIKPPLEVLTYFWPIHSLQTALGELMYDVRFLGRYLGQAESDFTK